MSFASELWLCFWFTYCAYSKSSNRALMTRPRGHMTQSPGPARATRAASWTRSPSRNRTLSLAHCPIVWQSLVDDRPTHHTLNMTGSFSVRNPFCLWKRPRVLVRHTWLKGSFWWVNVCAIYVHVAHTTHHLPAHLLNSIVWGNLWNRVGRAFYLICTLWWHVKKEIGLP